MTAAEKGWLCLVLHAHLPYVRHPEYEDFLEEKWFYEAVFETYIPLLDVFGKLENDGVDWKMTVTLTPTLVSMFLDPLLQERASRHINRLIELSEKEMARTKNSPEFFSNAKM